MTDNRGRPFDTALDEAILATAKAFLEENGFDGLTVSEIVERAGTTRSAFYRRYASLVEMITDLYLHEFPRHLDREFDTGSLVSDLRAAQEDQLAFFAAPMVYHAHAGFLGRLGEDSEARRFFMGQFVLPRRASVERIIDRAVQRGEIDPPQDVGAICDLMAAPFLLRIMMPELGPLDDSLLELTVAQAAAALGVSASQ
ncbi:MAG: TetR/AcrR family transcriptional regulator [Ancrocorticia sp.]